MQARCCRCSRKNLARTHRSAWSMLSLYHTWVEADDRAVARGAEAQVESAEGIKRYWGHACPIFSGG